MTEIQDYKQAFDFAIKQRDAVRKQRDELQKIHRKYMLMCIEARQLATKYYNALKALDVPSEEETLPWGEDVLNDA